MPPGPQATCPSCQPVQLDAGQGHALTAHPHRALCWPHGHAGLPPLVHPTPQGHSPGTPPTQANRSTWGLVRSWDRPSCSGAGADRRTSIPAPVCTGLAPFLPLSRCFPTLAPPQTGVSRPFPPFRCLPRTSSSKSCAVPKRSYLRPTGNPAARAMPHVCGATQRASALTPGAGTLVKINSVWRKCFSYWTIEYSGSVFEVSHPAPNSSSNKHFREFCMF